MSAKYPVSSLQDLYQAVQQAHENQAPPEIAVVGDGGTVVFRPE